MSWFHVHLTPQNALMAGAVLVLAALSILGVWAVGYQDASRGHVARHVLVEYRGLRGYIRRYFVRPRRGLRAGGVRVVMPVAS